MVGFMSNGVTFGVVTAQHWRSWPMLAEQWSWAEEAGWDSAWLFDHFFSLYDGEDGPTLDGWTALAGLACSTSRIRMGLMVTGNMHRNPAIMFKQAVTVDHLSGGRLILGMGAGWNEREHSSYGIPFPSARERVDRFGEAMELMGQLETQDRTTYHGEYYTLEDAPFAPKPVNHHIPVLIGSTGKRMLRHVARYADLWDGGGSPEEYVGHDAQLVAACREVGRDPSEIRRCLSTGADPLVSEGAFRQHVHAYYQAGVRDFMFDLPTGSPSATVVDISTRVIPELRMELAGQPG